MASATQGFDDLYRLYSRYVASIGFRLLGNDSEVDDLVQETFIAVARGIGTLRDPSMFKCWLGTIVVRSVSHRRGRRRRAHILQRSLSVLASAHSDPWPAAELYDWLDRIPERCRLPWLMHRIAGESLRETAVSCGCSLTTTKRLIVEAESRLRRHIDAE